MDPTQKLVKKQGRQTSVLQLQTGEEHHSGEQWARGTYVLKGGLEGAPAALIASAVAWHRDGIHLPAYGALKLEWSSKSPGQASLVAQWLRIHLPMQGTRVRALVREDPTCSGATKPMSHNY